MLLPFLYLGTALIVVISFWIVHLLAVLTSKGTLSCSLPWPAFEGRAWRQSLRGIQQQSWRAVETLRVGHEKVIPCVMTH